MTLEGAKFLLDANVLITAHRSYYAFDLCPGFWNAMKNGFAAGRVYSTRRVRAELRQGGDALADWIDAELPEDFFMDDSVAIPNPMPVHADLGPHALEQTACLPSQPIVWLDL